MTRNRATNLCQVKAPVLTLFWYNLCNLWQTLIFSSNDTLTKTDYGNQPNLRRHIKHLVSLLHFMAVTWLRPWLPSRVNTCRQQCGLKLSKPPNHSISLKWTSDIPQHTVRYQVTSLANMQLSHYDWLCCSGCLWVRMCNGNSLILTLLFHSEYETCLPRGQFAVKASICHL